MIVSLHKNMWKDTVRNAAVHKIMWPTAFAVNTHEIMSSAAWLFLSTKMNDTVELKIWNTIRVCKDLNLFHHSLLKRLRLMRGPFFCYLSLSGARLSFKLMPKLARGYGGKHQDHLVRPMLQVNRCCTRLPGWIQLKVTASVTLVNCLIFQSILQCSLHSISQPPHIRYCNWAEITLRTPRVQSVTCLLWSRGNRTRYRVDSERCVHQSSCRH